ncbi:MAG: secretin N-terminal domain-containing protein, partial [Candidatus Omnitrophota bacterium]
MTKKLFIILLVFLVWIFSPIPMSRAQYDYQIELISLDLKDMDIRDILKILSQKSGVNIVADSEIKASVTLYIRDVEIMDALDIIVSVNNLAYKQEGTLIRIMTDERYERLYGKRFRDKSTIEIVKLDYADAASVASSIKEMKSGSGKIIPDIRSNTIILIDNRENIDRMKDVILEMDEPLITEVFFLDYAKAKTIKDNLKGIVSEVIGSVSFDERTNRIVVQDTPRVMQDIRKIIEVFDQKQQEVVIDTSIIEEEKGFVETRPEPIYESEPKVRTKKSKWTPILGASREEKKQVISLDKESSYEDYSFMIAQEINYMATQQDVSGLEGSVELQFTLDRDGFIVRGPVVLNKPELELVRAAVGSLKSMSPFPPFPETMKDEDREFYV